MKDIYLDNSATTKTYDEVNDIMLEVLKNAYGNPSSLHRYGMAAEKYIKNSAKIIADSLGVSSDEIYFTSGGTEADNMAIIGSAMANKRKGNHIITTKIEHSAVLETVKYLGENGFDIDYLSVDNNGNISLDELETLLKDTTVLVSVMQVNNEVGSIMPIDKIKAIIKKKSPNALFHVDAVQGYGKIQLTPNKMGVDMLSISSHKIHGPKGVGALYVKKGVRIVPVVYGGHQQKGLRSGTENTPGIAGFGVAAKMMYDSMGQNYEHVLELKNMLINGILREINDVVINGDENGIAHVLNVSFLGIKSEILLHSLESKGVYISTGSACSSNKPMPSAVLTAMGKNKAEIEGAIRFSFSELNTKDEIEYVIDCLKSEVTQIRRYVRR